MTAADTTPATELVAMLGIRLGADVVISDPDIVAGYAHDQSSMTTHGTPVAVLAPRTTDQVAQCLRAAHEHGITVIPRGAGSGLSGAANAIDGSVILSLHRMNGIVEIDRANRLAVVQPGVITADLRAAVVEHDLYYPPDPGSVEFSTIGGNIATNAGGLCCVKYGVTGDFVKALEVVLADGRVLRTGHRTVKGVAGYDLTHLFVGSEGTLGVVTEATLKLLPAPRPAHTMLATFPEMRSAGRTVSAIVEEGLTPSMLEILDRTTIRAVDEMSRMGLGESINAMLLVQSDDPDASAVLDRIAELCNRLGASDTAITSDPVEGAMLLEARRLALPALEHLGDWMLDDVCVPVTAVSELIESIDQISVKHGLTIGVFGHAGNGNLHPTIIYNAQDADSRAAVVDAFNDITREALLLGGTVTGEHGVGQLKKSWLATEQGAVGIDVHRDIKQALDPCGILNPAALFDQHRSVE